MSNNNNNITNKNNKNNINNENNKSINNGNNLNENNELNYNLDNTYVKFIEFIKKEPNKKDLITYLKFIFHDFKIIKDDDVNKNNFNSLKNNFVSDVKNKLINLSNSNIKIQKNKSDKLIKKIKENAYKIKPFGQLIDKKLKNLKASENAPNIKFNNNINLKVKKNIFSINSSFKYKIGELLMRFLFTLTIKELNDIDGQPFIGYNNQKDFYYDSIKNILDRPTTYNPDKLHTIIPQFIYLYNYFFIIESMFQEELNLNEVFNEKKMKDNIKKLYEFYKIGKKQKPKSDKKGKKGKKEKSKGKKGKSDKKRKISDPIIRGLRGMSGGENNNNNNNNDKNEYENNNNKFSSNIKKDETFKLKDKFLKIIKNINLYEKVSLSNGNETNNLYKIYEDFNKIILNDYFEQIIENASNNNNNRQDLIKTIEKEVDHPFVKDDVESKIKIQNILKNRDKTLKEISDSGKKKEHQVSTSQRKKILKSNIDYKYKFNILQLLRTNIINKNVFIFLKRFNTLFMTHFFLLIRKFLEIKVEIYKELLELNINEKRINSHNKNKKVINKNILTLINGTKINIKNFNNSKNKKILQKIKILMEQKQKLNEKYNKNYDEKLLIIQKLITKLLIQLKK